MASFQLHKKLALLASPCGHLPPRQRWAFKLLYFFFGHYIAVENQQQLQDIRYPAIFAFNHNNALETLLIALFFYDRLRNQKVVFVCDWMYGRLPLVGWFINLTDPVYVYTKKARFAAMNRLKHPDPETTVLQACRARLQQNCSIGIFPEGTRNGHPRRLRRGRRGIGALALETGRPVIPVGVVFPPGRRRGSVPAWGPMTLRVGRPLEFPAATAAWTALSRDPRGRPRGRPGTPGYLAARVTHAVMAALARLSGKRYPYPPPVAPLPARPFIPPISPKDGCHGEDRNF